VRHNRLYRNGVLEQEDFECARISDHLEEPDTVVWLDLETPTKAELGILAEEFGLSPLAVEDAINEHQRPKVDRYDSHLFLSVYGVGLEDSSGELATMELAIFAAERWLITVRKTPGFDMAGVKEAWDANPELAKNGVSFLLHGLLDHVIDAHFQVVQDLDDCVEAIEDRLFDPKPQTTAVQRRSYEMRKSLVRLRRVALPMREVLNTLMRRDLHVVTSEMQPYYQDVYDHVLRVTEWTESLRDLVTTIQDSNLQIQSNRLNEVMKKLTAYAAIFAVPTAITGFYGQNVPYPGFGSHAGFVSMVVFLVAATLGLVAFFKVKHWL